MLFYALKKERPQKKSLFIPWLFCRNRTTLLLNTGSLTSELAQIVELSATYLTNLVNLDALNSRRLDREDTLHTYST